MDRDPLMMGPGDFEASAKPPPSDPLMMGPESFIRPMETKQPKPDPLMMSPEQFASPPAERPTEKGDGLDYGTIALKSFGRGAMEAGKEMAAGVSAAAPSALGGTPIAQQPQLEQGPKDELDQLLDTPLHEGWTNGKWWAAQTAKAVGSSIPSTAMAVAGGLAGGAAGTAVGGPPGAVVGGLGGGAAGFALGSALQTVVPSYQRAVADGLSSDDAMERALIETGVAASFGAAMGIAPGGAIYGRVAVQKLDGTVANVLRRPFLEALTQMGIIQPGLSTIQAGTTSAIEGRTITPSEAAQTFVFSGLGSIPLVGAHAAFSGVRGALGRVDAAASPEGIEAAHVAGGERVVEEPPPGGPKAVVPPATIDQLSRASVDNPTWYSALHRQIETKGPAAWPAWRWAKLIEGVEGGAAEQEWLRLPQYLADKQGNVSKQDLVAYIEEHQVRIEETTYQKGRMPPGLREEVEPIIGRLVETSGEHEEGIRNSAAVLHRLHGRGLIDPEEYQALNAYQAANRQGGRYERYTLPGPKENYREILLRMGRPTGLAQGDFQSGHFNDPNILAHFRTTDRIDREGKRTLNIEEIQSDWHQTGKARGYKGDPIKTRPLTDEENEFAGGVRDIMRNGRSISPEDLNRYNALLLQRIQHDTETLGRVPNAPFKTNWDELAFKRVLRMAADEGYERVTWTNGDQQALRYQNLNERQQRGMREFYGSGDTPGRLSNIAKKWANRLGMQMGETRLDFGERPEELPPSWTRVEGMGLTGREWDALHDPTAQRMRYVDISPAASDRIRLGFPLHSRMGVDVQEVRSTGTFESSPDIERLRPAARQIGRVVKSILKQMKVTEPLTIKIEDSISLPGGRAYGLFDPRSNTIHLGLAGHKSAEHMYGTVSHEFGHFIDKVLFERAPDTIKLHLLTAFNNFLTERPPGETIGQMSVRRDNALSPRLEGDVNQGRSILAMTPERQQYWYSFEEWKAEQVARWMTTSVKPLSVVDKFFASLGRAIRRAVETFQQRFGMTPDPVRVVKDWLDSHIESALPYAADIIAETQIRTQREAREAMEREGVKDFPAEPQQPESGGVRGGIGALFPQGTTPREAAGMLAAMDKFSSFIRNMLNLPQIAAINKHIKGLQIYREVVQLMHVEKDAGLSRAHDTLQMLKKLGTVQRDALVGLIHDHMNGVYLTPEERMKGVERRPTKDEFATMVRRNGVGDRGLTAFTKIQSDFRWFLQQVRDVQARDANRIVDPLVAAQKIEDIDRGIAAMQRRDYFPQTRFGEFTYTVRDAAGHVKEFRTFETEKQRNQWAARARVEPGDRVDRGRLAKDATPMFGMPPGLLNKMEEKLDLSTAQRQALDELRYQYSPAQSFAHHLRLRKNIPGWSDDFVRSYASYFFHGMNHLVKVKYVDQLRDVVKETRAEGRLAADHTRRDEIVNWMSEHLRGMLDPKPDWAILRGVGSLWFLGYQPASATLNLSQMLFNSGPRLGQDFGVVRGWAEMARAVANRGTFFKKATLATATEGETRMLGNLVREGTIDENLAPQLAAQAEGRNLLTGFGRNAAERMWHGFLAHSMDMFQLTEQTNRRVTAVAAYRLALAHPDARAVRQAVETNPLQFARLKEQGLSDREAAAQTYAKNAVEDTQYIYARWARPRFMEGAVPSNLLLFKIFTQNSLFFLWNNKPAALQSMLIMAGLGGLMGLPGLEDINGIIKGIAYRLFGADFDLDDKVRDFVTQWMKGGGTVGNVSDIRTSEGGIRPDVILHGLSRVGYGLPQLAGTLGIPLPTLDRSRSIGMGNVLPIEPNKMIGPQRDAQSAELGQVQSASGATFGLGFALLKALTDAQLDLNDFKRWEPVMPRFAANVSQSFRYWHEGMERDRKGAATTRFDPYDATNMMEIIARAGGYQPARKTIAGDLIGAQSEASTYWDLRRQGLIHQAWTARQTGDPDAWKRMLESIQGYNAALPEEARGKAITSDALRQAFVDRTKAIALREQGLPGSKKDVPLYEAVRRQYPEAETVGSRTVR